MSDRAARLALGVAEGTPSAVLTRVLLRLDGPLHALPRTDPRRAAALGLVYRASRREPFPDADRFDPVEELHLALDAAEQGRALPLRTLVHTLISLHEQGRHGDANTVTRRAARLIDSLQLELELQRQRVTIPWALVKDFAALPWLPSGFIEAVLADIHGDRPVLLAWCVGNRGMLGLVLRHISATPFLKAHYLQLFSVQAGRPTSVAYADRVLRAIERREPTEALCRLVVRGFPDQPVAHWPDLCKLVPVLLRRNHRTAAIALFDRMSQELTRFGPAARAELQRALRPLEASIAEARTPTAAPRPSLPSKVWAPLLPSDPWVLIGRLVYVATLVGMIGAAAVSAP